MKDIITWNQEMSVGRVDIDNQHKKLVLIINWLHREVSAGSTCNIGRILESLLQYTAYHFGYEEDLFAHAGYPWSDGHKREHANFIEFMMKQQERWEMTGEENLEGLRDYLKAWLVEHICGADKAMIRWLSQGDSIPAKAM